MLIRILGLGGKTSTTHDELIQSEWGFIVQATVSVGMHVHVLHAGGVIHFAYCTIRTSKRIRDYN